jgi:poly-gamma-glutamate synthesis protein (capsule biosynthesis protein)
MALVKSFDYFVINLEAPITDSNNKIKKTGPCLRVPPSAFSKELTLSGNFIAALSNNHIKDFGEKGIKDTIDCLRDCNIKYLGAGASRGKAREPIFLTDDNLKVALINVSENEWSSADENIGGAFGFDFIDGVNDIKSAKNQADRVVLIYHGGHEFNELPSPQQKKLFRFFIDCGVDVVICHHSHIVSGYERHGEGVIFYGLGNFYFPKKEAEKTWYCGIIVELDLSVDGISFSVTHSKFSKEGAVDLVGSKLEEDSAGDEFFEINSIIADDSELGKHWADFCQRQEAQILNYIAFPRIISGIFRRLLPNHRFASNRFLFRLHNHVRCESHRSVLLFLANKNTVNDEVENARD